MDEGKEKSQQQTSAWDAEVSGLRELVQQLEARLADSREREQQLQVANDRLRAEEDRMRVDLHQQEIQNNSYLRQIRTLHEKAEELTILLHGTQGQPRTARDEVNPPPVKEPDDDAWKRRGQDSTNWSDRTRKGNRAKPSRMVLTRRARLWRKFRKNPRQYFADSRIVILRPLRHLF